MTKSIYPKIKEYAATLASLLMAIAAVGTSIGSYYRPTNNEKYDAQITTLQTKLSQVTVQQYESELKLNKMLEWKTKLESDARVEAELAKSEEVILYRTISKKFGPIVAKAVLEQRKKIIGIDDK